MLPGFLVQFGCAADPALQSRWESARLPDEPNRRRFQAGTLSFAGNGVDSRTCHLFVALEPKGSGLGKAAHEATIGWVEGMEVFERVVQNFESHGYPDLGDLQDSLVRTGNQAAAAYSKLDRIVGAKVVSVRGAP